MINCLIINDNNFYTNLLINKSTNRQIGKLTN